jgi:hypothetical protein
VNGTSGQQAVRYFNWTTIAWIIWAALLAFAIVYLMFFP